MALLAHLIDALTLGVGIGQLHQRVAHHDVIVLIAAHEAADHDLAGQAARVGQRAGFRSQQSWDIRMPESQHFSTL